VRGLDALVGIFIETEPNDAVQSRRCLRAEGADRGRVQGENLPDDAGLRLAFESAPARDHLEQHHAERENVRAGVSMV
jgi:hypothetical protein